MCFECFGPCDYLLPVTSSPPRNFGDAFSYLLIYNLYYFSLSILHFSAAFYLNYPPYTL
jgi:hypothetical protein